MEREKKGSQKNQFMAKLKSFAVAASRSATTTFKIVFFANTYCRRGLYKSVINLIKLRELSCKGSTKVREGKEKINLLFVGLGEGRRPSTLLTRNTHTHKSCDGTKKENIY